MIHPLENRILFALAVSLNEGYLQVNGTDVGDAITIDLADSMLSVRINTVNFSIPAADVNYISVKGGFGADLITFTPAVNIKASVYGGDGNDRLSGGTKSNAVFGEAGHDTLGGGISRDTFNGGPGIDTVDYSLRTEGLVITLDGKPNDGAPAAGKKKAEHDNVSSDIENVVGGAGDDRIFGSKGTNTLQGGPGNDSIAGGGGNDLLVGGAGADTLRGDEGDDLLLAIDSATSDLIDGGLGFDSAALDSITSVKDTLLGIENEASILTAP